MIVIYWLKRFWYVVVGLFLAFATVLAYAAKQKQKADDAKTRLAVAKVLHEADYVEAQQKALQAQADAITAKKQEVAKLAIAAAKKIAADDEKLKGMNDADVDRELHDLGFK